MKVETPKESRFLKNLRRVGLMGLLIIVSSVGADVTHGNSEAENLPSYYGAVLSGLNPDDTLVVADLKHRYDLLNLGIPKDIIVVTEKGNKRVTLNEYIGSTSWTSRWKATATEPDGTSKQLTCNIGSRTEFSQICR